MSEVKPKDQVGEIQQPDQSVKQQTGTEKQSRLEKWVGSARTSISESSIPSYCMKTIPAALGIGGCTALALGMSPVILASSAVIAGKLHSIHDKLSNIPQEKKQIEGEITQKNKEIFETTISIDQREGAIKTGEGNKYTKEEVAIAELLLPDTKVTLDKQKSELKQLQQKLDNLEPKKAALLKDVKSCETAGNIVLAPLTWMSDIAKWAGK